MENDTPPVSLSEKPIKKTKLFKSLPEGFFLGLISGILSISIAVAFTPLGKSLSPAMVSNKGEGTDGFSKNPEQACTAFLKFKEIKNSFIPAGVPKVYGPELNISFDKVQDAINKVSPLDPTFGPEGKKITLTGDSLKRYIKIGSEIACQYCCDAKTLVQSDGVAACGCDHSQMMRGLMAYLIKNHPEMSDEQILQELKTWKISYFPKQMLTDELSRREKAGEPGIKDILQEFPEFLPQMVGGC